MLEFLRFRNGAALVMLQFLEFVLVGSDFFVTDQAFYAGLLVPFKLGLRMSDLRQRFLLADAGLVHLKPGLRQFLFGELQLDPDWSVVQRAENLTFFHEVAFLREHLLHDAFGLSCHGDFTQRAQIRGGRQKSRDLASLHDREFDGSSFFVRLLTFLSVCTFGLRDGAEPCGFGLVEIRAAARLARG